MSLIQYPSCVANFKLTFDETLTLITYPQPVSVDAQVASVQGPPVPAFEPLILEQDGSNFSFVANRVPITAGIKLNGYRQASTFEATFSFRDMPIDPRTVRGAAVELHVGTVSPAEFQAGMRGGQTGGSLRSILQTRLADGRPNPDTLVGVFSVDVWKVINGEKSATVSMSGRDLRGILIDTPIGIAPNASVQLLDSLNLALPIDQVVKQILRFNPAFESFRVICNPAEWGGSVPAPNFPSAVPRHRLGARGTRTSGRGNPPSGQMDSVNFWDLITRFCYLVGAIPYFQGTDILIRPARTVFDQNIGPVDPVRNPTPFAGGLPRDIDAQSGQQIQPMRSRKLVYGRDIINLEFERKFGGYHRPRVVRAVSVADSAPVRGELRTIVGVWPPRTDPQGQRARRTRVSPSAQRVQEEIINVPVAGVTDPVRLVEIARSVFEEIGRGELGGSLTTRNITSYGGDNADPDLVRMRPGDGVEILTDMRGAIGPSPLVSPANAMAGAPFEAQVAEITARLGDQNLARIIVATARGQVFELQRFFRVQNVKIDWDKGGFRFNVDFHNYVVARNQMTQAQRVSSPATTTVVPSSVGQGPNP
jgi:hypothetical protein